MPKNLSRSWRKDREFKRCGLFSPPNLGGARGGSIYLYNDNKTLETRRKLRKTMPAPEVIFWQKLRAGQLNGLKFRRQHGIGGYIVDFYCPEKRLVIEIDGDSHYEKNAIERDIKRQNFIESKKLKILRFTNKEIMENIEGVVLKIIEIANTSLNPS